MARDFTVSLVLQARNNMSPSIRQAVNDIRGLRDSTRSMSSEMGGNSPFKSWQQDIKEAGSLLKQAFAGVGLAWTGKEMLGGLSELAKKAGEVQMQMVQLSSVYGLNIDDSKLQEITKTAQTLSQQTLFSQKETLGIGVELAHAGISRQALPKVMKESTYLAEVEVGMGKSSSANQTAYNFARMAEDARITNSEARMAKFADTMSRVISVTHASSESLGETFKYSMPVVKNLGWNENDLLMASGLAARAGMEGSMAGTHIKDFAERINPYKYLNTKGGQKQLGAMYEAGLIDNVTFAKDKKGKLTNNIIGFGSAALLKNHDQLKSYESMIPILSQKHDAYIKKGHGELEWAALMNKIYGEQGQDFAIISSHKDMFEKLKQQMNVQKSLHQQIAMIRGTFVGQSHIAQSQLQTLGLQLGQPLMQWATPALKTFTDGLSKLINVLQNHPAIAKFAAATAGVVAGLVTLTGVALSVVASIKAIKLAAKLLNPVSLFKRQPASSGGQRGVRQMTRNRLTSMSVNAARVYVNGPVSSAVGANRGRNVGGSGRRGAAQREPITYRERRRFTVSRPPEPPQRRTLAQRIFRRRSAVPTTGLEARQISRVARAGRVAGVAGAVVGAGMTAYGAYQDYKQGGWKQAISNNGAAATLGLIGGGVGLLGGPVVSALAGMAGQYIGSMIDQSGFTKKIVDSISGWWTKGSKDTKDASKDMTQVRLSTGQTASFTKQQVVQLAQQFHMSTEQTKAAMNQVSQISSQGNAWGTKMISGMTSGVLAGLPAFEAALRKMQEAANIHIQMPSFSTSDPALNTPAPMAASAFYHGVTNKPTGPSYFPKMPRMNANGNILGSHGGIINSAHWVSPYDIAGEAGPEAVIPLSSGRRSRGIQLWQQAGHYLGAFNSKVNYHANGAILRASGLGSTTLIGRQTEGYTNQQQYDWKDTVSGLVDAAKEVSEYVGHASYAMLKRASMPVAITSEFMDIAQAGNKAKAALESVFSLGGALAGARYGASLGSKFAPNPILGTAVGSILGGTIGGIAGRLGTRTAASAAMKPKAANKQFVPRAQAVHHDNRKISIAIHPTNAKEAEEGVEKALMLSPKYIASRGKKKAAWEF
ncbi:phage tail tape measure protein [Aneurinibacillus sp. Ricciae_BoGa-3]|uniref:phage tail tape measure protein n=1 Tax=Aneurinibacillus sp. Ricciae_BoGa-3 TaxID=3022697 RepID=UPI0023417C26|nr:phage tail tape measure protein [Aneurinibacillus sp. Ricciae_BoGa-3]WCK53835.1 phage tail tape measure protein [Aneurinibacillus sp. Ricciae_BoGa-3]